MPEFLTEIPDSMIETEWASFKEFELAETAIPNKYKELIGKPTDLAAHPSKKGERR